MKKQLIVLLVFGLVLCSLCYLVARKINQKQIAEENQQMLPTITAWSIDSIAFTYQPPLPSRPILVVYFNTECGICQYEAGEIKQHIDDLRQTNILMVSSEPLPAIQQFAQQHALDQHVNITFGKMDAVAITHTFGAISVPNIFIYDQEQKLVKHYKGETKIQAIMQYL